MGESRHMGPEPHLVRIALESLQEDTPPQLCTEKVVMGKVMEVKGKMLQLGLTPRMAINLTFAHYKERLEKMGSIESVPAPEHLRMLGRSTTPGATTMDEDVEKNTLRTEKQELTEENSDLRQRLKKAEEKAERLKGMVQTAKAKSPARPKTQVRDVKKTKKAAASASNSPDQVVRGEGRAEGIMRVLKGALQRLRLRMSGAGGTTAESEEVSNASQHEATRHHDGTTFACERQDTTNDNTLNLQMINGNPSTTIPTPPTTTHGDELYKPPFPPTSNSTKKMDAHGVVDKDSIGSLASEAGQRVPMISEEQRHQSNKNNLPQSSSRRIACGMAALGAMVMLPIQGLMAQISMVPDFVEVACSPTSSLSEEMTKLGFMSKRVNYREGFDLESPKGTAMLKQQLVLHPPRCTWISLLCTRLSPLVNLTERTPEDWARFEQRQMKDLKRAEEVADAVGDAIEKRPEADFAWEWPTGAAKGWKSRAIRKLVYRMAKLEKKVYWCRFHGCAYGLEYRGLPVQKSWTVLTTNRHIWMALQKKCPGHPEHVHCRGEAAKASSYYPMKMVKAVTRGLVDTWTSHEKCCGVSLAEDVEQYLLEIPKEAEDGKEAEECCKGAREDDPHVLALTRDRFTSEPPKGKKLEQMKQQMMRIHRASGHSSFANPQRLLRMRKAPDWAHRVGWTFGMCRVHRGSTTNAGTSGFDK